ncbi:Serine/threonine-protein kinase LATS1 [Halotydeus destructor]|nr:Serine/threonine-protein kinase LATS1 [Halotydeus destructor]
MDPSSSSSSSPSFHPANSSPTSRRPSNKNHNNSAVHLAPSPVCSNSSSSNGQYLVGCAANTNGTMERACSPANSGSSGSGQVQGANNNGGQGAPVAGKSTQYRQKALQEIRNSLLPFMNNERLSSSSARSASNREQLANARRPSLLDNLQSLDSTPNGSCAGSVRSDSPGLTNLSHKQAERLMSAESARLLASGMHLNYSTQELSGQSVHHHPHYYHHVQIARQHSSNSALYQNGHINGSLETPPPLPPPRGVSSSSSSLNSVHSNVASPFVNGSHAQQTINMNSVNPVLNHGSMTPGGASSSSTSSSATAAQYHHHQQQHHHRHHPMLKRGSPMPSHHSNGTNGSSNGHVTNGMSSRSQAFSYASSGSSSSPPRSSSPVPPFSANGGLVNGASRRDSSSSLTTNSSATTNGPLSHLTPSQQQQLAQKLQALELYNSTAAAANSANRHQMPLSSQHQPPSYPHSPASLSSLYSSISSPLPSYAASSSSGRQSPTPTISSSSEYSVPPSLMHAQLQKMFSSAAASTCSSKASSISASSSNISAVSSVISSKHSTCGSAARPGSSQLHAWSARQAKSQSPVIMQSVKSTQVQKPVLQTAIAPVAPPPPPSSSQPSATGVTSGPNGNNINNCSAATPAMAAAAGCGSSSKSNHHTSSAQASLSSSVNSVTSLHKANDAVNFAPSSTALAATSPTESDQSTGQQTSLSKASSCTTSSNPPPYAAKCAPTGQHQSSSQQQQAYSGRTSSGIPPPPPYASAVQDKQQKQHQQPVNGPPCPVSSNSGGGNTRCTNSAPYEPNNSNDSPPPPPPPPYTATLATVTQDKSQVYLPRPAAPSPIASDPPSYASSVAANMKQRAANPGQVPARPPPPLPPNSDLVNTVESICASQVGASNGPSLPPKPCVSSVQHQYADTTSLSESECSSITSNSNMSLSSNMTSSCSITISTGSSAPRRPAPPPPRAEAKEEQPITPHLSPMPARKKLSKERELERKESKVRNYSPAAYKFFMEQHVENVIKFQQQRQERRLRLEAELANSDLPEETQEQMRKFLQWKESNYIRLRRAKMNKTMFKTLKTIGVGAFGEVTLVQKEGTPQLYAMKTLRKKEVLKRNQVAHVKAERDILAEADNEWVVKLWFSFQDADHLYFVMEYIPGGDLMNLLIKKEIFSEKMARFYIAELTLAVESVHKMGFIHRDIKPDNILIDHDGHIKLTDFGLCTGFRWTHNSKYYQRNGSDHNRQDSMDAIDDEFIHCAYPSDTKGQANGISNIGSCLTKPLERRRKRCMHQRCQAHSLVGTPNYIAPEVLMRTGYTQTCDWWSVGVIFYEMIVGQPPFYDQSPERTQARVINWKNTLSVPPNLSSNATDLIRKLCCGPEERLGRNGADEIKGHAFLDGVNFDPVKGLRKHPAAYVPQVMHPADTSNFDAFDDEHNASLKSHQTDYVNGDRMDYNGKHPDHAFFEFTFRRFFDDAGQPYPIRVKDFDRTTNGRHNSGDNSQASPVYV